MPLLTGSATQKLIGPQVFFDSAWEKGSRRGSASRGAVKQPQSDLKSRRADNFLRKFPTCKSPYYEDFRSKEAIDRRRSIAVDEQRLAGGPLSRR
jgi:hypothetical protein